MMEDGNISDEDQNLFAEDDRYDDDAAREEEEERNNPDDYAVEVPASGTQANQSVNLDVTAVTKAKRVIKNPQPKFNPDRLMGPRGLMALTDEFKDWKPRGPGHEFDDLDQMMYKLNYWTHRFFPKLPFDATINTIENRLGNKKVVQAYMKKIRLDMVTVPVRQEQDQQVVDNDDDGNDVARYDDDNGADSIFPNEESTQIGGASQAIRTTSNQGNNSLSEEQLERMKRNKLLAAQKKKEREERKRLQELEEDEALRMTSNNHEADMNEETMDPDLEQELMQGMMEAENEMIDRTTQRLTADCNITNGANTPTEKGADAAIGGATNVENGDVTNGEVPVSSQSKDSSTPEEMESNSGHKEASKESDKEDQSENLLDMDQMMENMEDDI